VNHQPPVHEQVGGPAMVKKISQRHGGAKDKQIRWEPQKQFDT
jgi:hypothetical protein